MLRSEDLFQEGQVISITRVFADRPPGQCRSRREIRMSLSRLYFGQVPVNVRFVQEVRGIERLPRDRFGEQVPGLD